MAAVETRFGVRFPPDYRALLLEVLPISDGFVDWRRDDPSTIREEFDWPYEGIYGEVEHHQFWLPDWGKRPKDSTKAVTIAEQALQQVPVLIPIKGHRYIPATPNEGGNPVFSIVGLDIIYYGADLVEYLENELSSDITGTHRYHITEPVKSIPFWSSLVD
ncbi:MAG: SMI1/KNR4 family protein [Chloroflexaceae bacterium]|nr:SMI1/KNR4 family protein [Chloroflexaceae bacterium]